MASKSIQTHNLAVVKYAPVPPADPGHPPPPPPPPPAP